MIPERLDLVAEHGRKAPRGRERLEDHDQPDRQRDREERAGRAGEIHAHATTAIKTTSGLRLSSLPMATGWRNWSWAKLMRV